MKKLIPSIIIICFCTASFAQQKTTSNLFKNYFFNVNLGLLATENPKAGTNFGTQLGKKINPTTKLGISIDYTELNKINKALPIAAYAEKKLSKTSNSLFIYTKLGLTFPLNKQEQANTWQVKTIQNTRPGIFYELAFGTHLKVGAHGFQISFGTNALKYSIKTKEQAVVVDPNNPFDENPLFNVRNYGFNNVFVKVGMAF